MLKFVGLCLFAFPVDSAVGINPSIYGPTVSASLATVFVQKGQTNVTSSDDDILKNDRSAYLLYPDLPILVFGTAISKRDIFSAHRYAKDLYGIPSNQFDVLALENDTYIWLYWGDIFQELMVDKLINHRVHASRY